MAKTSSKKTNAGAKKKVESKTQETKPRLLKKPVYASFRLQKRIKGAKVVSAFRLFGRAVVMLKTNWKLFGGIALWYGLLSAVLVQGLSMGNANPAGDGLDQFLDPSSGQLTSDAGLSNVLSASGGVQSSSGGLIQFSLVFIFSLAIIWALRQVYAGHAVRIRDSFYHGMTPFVPFLLVLLVVLLQLVPMALGGMLYTTVVGNGIAISAIEHLLWLVLFFALTVISLYMLASSLFALYIVTLPDMTPFRALRSARQLVRNRRWSVMRKVIFLPIVLFVIAAILIVPLAFFAAPAAPWVFLALMLLLLPLIHSYMYGLYRALL